MILLLILSLLVAQTPAPQTPSVDEKSQQIIDHEIEVVGGQKYVGVQTVIGKGFYTSFKDGVSQLPARFLDYISYPNSERTEFSGAGIKTIQTNSGDTGWTFDGAVKKISDQSPAQVEEFKHAIRTS